MPRPATTLIFVSRRMVARADCNGAKLAEFWSRQRPEIPDLASAVDLAISLEPNIGKRVWVLTTDAWTQTLGLPRNKVVGLSEEELAGALNFEVEAHSGVSALEAALAFVPLPPLAGNRDFQFWLTQVPLADRDQIDDLIYREGGRLAGIIHPAGLPAPATLPPRGPFGRMELWPDAVVGVWSPINEPPSLLIWNADPSSDRWHVETRQWCELKTPNRFEWLTADGYAPPAGATALTSLDDEAGLKNFLHAWAAVLQRKPGAVPVVRPGQRPMPVRQRWAIAAGLALFTASLCGAHWYAIDRQVTNLQTETAANVEKSRRIDETAKLVVAKTKERDAQRIKRDQREAATNKLQTQRTRITRLLELLANGANDDVMIQSIENENGVLKIVGLALKPEMADAYARVLSDALQPLGWNVNSGVEAAKGGGLWKFDVAIRNVIEPKVEPPTTPAGRRS